MLVLARLVLASQRPEIYRSTATDVPILALIVVQS
jgi:hypothetical protein